MVIIFALFVLLIILNYKVWTKDHQQEQQIRDWQSELATQRSENEKIQSTNDDLRHKIDSLKRGSHEMIEEEARDNFGMVGKDETFYHIEPEKAKSKP